MTRMVYSELKKMFARPGGRISLLLLCAVVGITSYLAVCGVGYVDEQGGTTTGPAAIRRLREAKEEWAGPVDEETIRLVIEENARINATPEAQSANITQNEIAYGKKQGFSDLRTLIVRSFCGFRDFDYYLPDSLAPEDAALFYSNRLDRLKEWLDGEAEYAFSAEEKDWMMQKYRELPTPLWYSYADGWVQLLEYSATIVMFIVLIVSFPIAGIFSSEFTWKTDAVFFSARHGRNRATAAKLLAGFLSVTGVYWTFLLLYTAIVLGFLGTGGADCLIVISRWKTLYYLTYREAWLLTALGGYIGCLFLMLLVMLASAKTRSAVFAVTIPFLLIFAPTFLNNLDNPHITKLIALLPDQLLQMNTVFALFAVYDIGGHIVLSAPLLFVIYTAGVLLLFPLIYRIYRRSQVA